MRLMTILLVLLLLGFGCTDKPAKEPSPKPAPVDNKDKVDSATEQKNCPVMGNPINKDCYVDYKGRRIYFCCPGCDKTFLSDPDKYLPKVDVDLAGKGPKQAPTATDIEQKRCPVMGGLINPDVFLDWKGRRVYFCCPPCIKTFKADPDSYLAKLDKMGKSGQ